MKKSLISLLVASALSGSTLYAADVAATSPASVENSVSKTTSKTKRAGSTSTSLKSYFQQHAGDYAHEIGMLNNATVKARLTKLLGAQNFQLFKSIYQTCVPIEFRSWMYWSYGFQAHNCCDPIAVWAYDINNNAFYVWMKIDAQEYWWSDTGTVPGNFQDLVRREI